MVSTIAASGVSGIIATNTTISREGLSHQHAKETEGLVASLYVNVQRKSFVRYTDRLKASFRLSDQAAFYK